MAEFLLELFSEEIPARMQARAAEELTKRLTGHLSEAGLRFGSTRSFVTPRRLVLVIDAVPLRSPDVTEERKGPREGAPEKAMQGFLAATGLTLERCTLRQTPKGNVWYAVIERPGRPAAEILAEAVTETLKGFHWPKSMRWADGSFRWVRPLHHVLAVFDGAALPGAAEVGNGTRFPFTAQTRGHRFLAPEPLGVTGFADYARKLHAAFVVLDPVERKRIIRSGAEALAAAEGLTVRDDPGLLDEVAGLVEWPVPLIGRIDEAFMEVPQEVLVTSMRSHQKYFALSRPDGSLAPYFITVANRQTVDGGVAVREGNERVLRARLSDATFFWDTDRQTSLRARAAELEKITFHARLGTMDQKVDRMQALAVALAKAVPGADPDRVASAARLAKADLVTGMVGEFPELQGIMGRYYALADGESAQVAEAIARHYAPLGPNDACPSAADNPAAVAVSLADKLDSLAGFFAIGEKPTGSRDPFALRRAALGIIRLILENGLRLALTKALGAALKLYRDTVRVDRGAVVADLMHFFADRLTVSLREQGVRHDLIDAVFALGDEDDLVRLLARVHALTDFLATEDGANLLVAYRRAANIARIERKKDTVDGFGAVDTSAFAQAEERALADALDGLAATLEPALTAEDFAGAMAQLAALRGPVDAFFDQVTVNADDPDLRRNRLALLETITATMDRIAVFARITE